MGKTRTEFERTFDSMGLKCPLRNTSCIQKRCTHFITEHSEKAIKYKCYGGCEPIDLWIEVLD